MKTLQARGHAPPLFPHMHIICPDFLETWSEMALTNELGAKTEHS